MVDPGMPKTVNITVPAGPKEGELITVVDTAVAGVGAGVGNEININPLGADTINGVAGPYVINTKNGSVTLRCDGGTNWVVCGSHVGVSADGYLPTNVTPDRAFDADTVTTAELADVVGTLIADLKIAKLLS
jgi:hypothetical protein